MPELPEVETVRRDLQALIGDGAVVSGVRLRRMDIRFPIPPELPAKLAHQPILGIRRRAKYLLFETPNGILLSHLGMTGTWRLLNPGEEDKHDHCYIDFQDGRSLAFRDPRRFGVLDWVDLGAESRHRLLKNLGPEPLGEDWTAERLWRVSRRRRVAIKVLMMNQNVLVGVGNIYASEALFRARVRPGRAAGRITRLECERIVAAIRKVLSDAIRAGGSSISDFHDASGAKGGYQGRFRVYDRKGEPCRACGTPIRSKIFGGRSTFWCPSCQV